MDLTPSQITTATFRTVRKGYDPDEVDAFLARVASVLEAAQQQATAMEARARAAVARLQEATAAQQGVAPEPAAPAPTAPDVRVAPNEAETISRTLLLAQRTADTTIAEARAEAERIAAEARSEADATLDSTREMSAQLLAEAKSEARKLTEQERHAVFEEVESLRARREFLIGDVDQLEQFLIDQRERLRGAAQQIEALCERVPSGLGTVRPPALSADDDRTSGDGAVLDETQELIVPPEAAGPFAGIDELAEAVAEAGPDAAPIGTGDWRIPGDPGPNVDPSDVPDLPHRHAPSE